MTRDVFMTEFERIYATVTVISDREDKKVLRYRHRTLGHDILLKLLPEDVPICRFLCGIKHENLPQIYDMIDVGDGFAVLEEFVPGMNIGDVLETGVYSYKGARKVLMQVCRALSVLHDNGFVHRDIKPDNVIISDDGSVKLVDFDASRSYSVEKNTDTQVLGTIGYAPPEQYGISQSDPRSDIYAVGVLLNVMVTGKHPSLRLANGRAGRIVSRCTQINPDQRFTDVKKLMKAM